jgi:hypothetical protein
MSQDSAEENKELVIRRWWGSTIRFSVCGKTKTKPSKRCVSVYYCSTYNITKLFALGEGDSGARARGGPNDGKQQVYVFVSFNFFVFQ